VPARSHRGSSGFPVSDPAGAFDLGGRACLVYDGNGNTATMTGYTMGVDYENRMNTITGSITASYKYDYEGRRS
jgi:hypothetical protein